MLQYCKMTIYFLVILPLPDRNAMQAPTERMVQLIPFTFIHDFIRETSFVLGDFSTYLTALIEPCFYTVIFNIFMTVPLGMYLHYYFKYNLKKVMAISFFVSLFFEFTQLSRLYFIYPYPYRVFDVDDLFMNTFGGCLGFFIMGWVSKFLPSREKIDERSFQNGKNVFGFRRITVFCLDLFLFLCLFLFTSLFIRRCSLKYFLFTIYYIVFPYLLNGETIGSKFLNVRFEYPNHLLIRTTLRAIFFYFYYFFLPFQFLLIVPFFKEHLGLDSSFTLLFFLIILFVLFLFYAVNISIILKKKTIFYDHFFKVIYKSTIEVNSISKDF